MGKRLWLVAMMLGTGAASLGSGCGGDEFTATGGNGAGKTTSGDGGGGSGGATISTATGGVGGEGGGVGGGPGGEGGGTTTTTGEGGGPVCQPISDPCAQCAYGACQVQYCQCYADMDCAQLVNCFQGCASGDVACQTTCMSAHEPSISQAFLLGECTAEPCAAECPGVGQVGPCEHCLFTNCPMQMNTCLANPDCYQLVTCVTGGGDVFACAQMYPGGFNDGLAVQSCMESSCADVCP